MAGLEDSPAKKRDFKDRFIRACIRNDFGENVYILIKPRETSYATQKVIGSVTHGSTYDMQITCHMLGHGKDIDERLRNSYWAWLDPEAWAEVVESDDLIEIGLDRAVGSHCKPADPPLKKLETPGNGSIEVGMVDDAGSSAQKKSETLVDGKESTPDSESCEE